MKIITLAQSQAIHQMPVSKTNHFLKKKANKKLN